MISYNRFRDIVNIGTFTLIIMMVLLHIFKVEVVWLGYTIGALLTVVGIFGMSDGYMREHGLLVISYSLTFLLVALIGINMLYPIPYLSGSLGFLPGIKATAMNYMVIMITEIMLLIDLFLSEI